MQYVTRKTLTDAFQNHKNIFFCSKEKMQETFIYDGKNHVSLDGSITYLGVDKWFLNRIAEFLWKEHQMNLQWREEGTEKFIACVKSPSAKGEEKANIEGFLEDPFSIRFVSERTSKTKEFMDEDIHTLHETIGELLVNEEIQ